MNEKIVFIKVENVQSQLFNVSDEICKIIDDECSYWIEGAQFSELYQRKVWDGYKHKFSIKKKKFPTGLLQKVTKILKKNRVAFKISDLRPEPDLDIDKIIDRLDSYGITPRPYQYKGIEKGIKNRNMMFWWPTGSGKTVLFCGLITAYDMRTLVLVNRKDLLYQHYNFIEKNTNYEVGMIGDGVWKPKFITIALIQSLWSKRSNSRALYRKLVESYEYLIIDEAHHGEAKTFAKITNDCTNASIRHGFSGTPYNLDSDDMELEAVTGSVLSKISVSYLIKKGYLSIPVVTMNDFDDPAHFVDGYKWIEFYKKGIVDNKRRNDVACKIIKEHYEKDKLILVTVQRKNHGRIIRKLLEGKFKIEKDHIEYLSGNDIQERRDEVRTKFEKGEIRIIIVTSIWNEGVDVPAANALVKLDGGGGKDVKDNKGVRSTIQQVGRVLRKDKKSGAKDIDTKTPQYVTIDDFVDTCNEYLRNHSRNREKTYRIEDAFIIKHRKWDK